MAGADQTLSERLLAGDKRALRELLALQASDWAFLVASATAGEYPRERAQWHARAFQRALERPDEMEPELRNLAPELVGWGG